MDFLEKLNYLMEKDNLNKSLLSKACDIPYTTIDGWYKKGYEGLKLTTLRKLANYFGTSLDFWASDNPQLLPESSDDRVYTKDRRETELLRDYRLLDKFTQTYVKGMIKGLAVYESINRRKAGTQSLSQPKHPAEEITKALVDLEPEYQQAVIELAKQLLAEQRRGRQPF